MKLKAAVLGVALAALGAHAAHAGTNWIGVSGGPGFPTGDYADAVATGWHLGATGTHLFDDRWGIGGDLGYNAWGSSEQAKALAEASFGPGSNISWNAIQADVHGTFLLPTRGNLKPYAQAGVGFYAVSSNLSTPAGDDVNSKTKLGFNVGGGMDIARSGNARWGVSGAYHTISARDDFGADVSFFTLGVNLMWGFSAGD